MKSIIAILFFIFFTNVTVAQPCTLKLYGHVVDIDTKQNLISANISIKEINKQITTDEKGDFVFVGLCTGDYTILISHVNCDNVEKKIRLTNNVHLDILMPHSRQLLNEVVIDAQKGLQNTGFKKELTGRALEETKGLSLAEALSRINGVTMLQTGSTIAKPVIHGLHSNRILTINNGVRQEGQQWGNEHAPEIDPFIASKLVVIKGVDELRYGSDAIGGVILVEPRALRDKPGYAAELNTAYFTNNRQYVVSGVFEKQLAKQPAFRYRLQGTFKKGANATTPNYRLNNTGSEEMNFSISAGWKKERFSKELFYSQFATKVGIFIGSHIGNLTDLQRAIAAPKPDDVFLGQTTYKINRPYQDVVHHLLKSKTIFYKGENKFSVLLAGQFNHRREFDVVRNSTNKSPQLDLSIYTLSQDITWEHPRKNNFSGIVGLALMQQNNSYVGRYFIPNYFSYSFGSYAIEKWSKQKWELQAGLRYDNKTISTTRLKFNGDTLNYDFHFSTFASSFNALYKAGNNWKLNTNISLASRAPHVNELLSDGIHHGTATYEKGDINLRPEQAINVNAGINFQNTHQTFSFDVNVYSNNIRNFIYQQPKPDMPVLTIAGAFPLIEYKQTNAVLSGVDVAASYKITPRFEWNPKLSVLYAWNKSTSDWLIWMPANRASNELVYNFIDKKAFANSYLSVDVTNVMQQKRTPGETNGKQDYKLPPAGYTLISLNASSTITLLKTPLTFSVGVRNALNTVYRDYLNNMRYFTDEMGRNINLRLKVPL
ncbi:MAG: TonB-dependent receptor [Ferruginibacter sp.]|nr:TonB-dependent receptor [Ferruginibacter sp.]